MEWMRERPASLPGSNGPSFICAVERLSTRVRVQGNEVSFSEEAAEDPPLRPG